MVTFDAVKARHSFAIALAVATFLLVIAGSLVTTTGSGLAVPDWPLSFGQIFPRMEGGVLFEHGHRLIATTIGVLTVVLAVWTSRAEPRRWVRFLGWAMLGCVVLQGVLGGVTVLLRLPPSISVAHAGLAQIFFAMTVMMASVTGSQHPAPSARPAFRLALVTALAIYVQIIVGAIVRHLGAGLAIPTLPLANGRVIPEFTDYLVAWQFAHRVMALLALLLVAATTARVVRRHPDAPSLTRPAALLSALAVWQILLGGLTIWTYRAITPVTAHVAGGALLFATSIVLAVRTRVDVSA